MCPSKMFTVSRLFAKNLNDFNIHLFEKNWVAPCQYVFNCAVSSFA